MSKYHNNTFDKSQKWTRTTILKRWHHFNVHPIRLKMWIAKCIKRG